MKIYLVQHGEAVSKEIDPERPLSATGEAEVTRVAQTMQRAGHGITRILHSGKLRAQQTAQIFADELLRAGSVEVIDDINPNDPVKDFSFAEHHIKDGTMLVGHLPFMERLVSMLVTGMEEPVIVNYKPGSVVCVARDEAGHWYVEWMIRPDAM